jgi:hypothetical protein
MTIDERLDRLTERHEALTQTVELLTRDLQSIRDFSKDIAQGTARPVCCISRRSTKTASLVWRT